MKLLDVSINDINLKDERFRFSYQFDLEKLLFSIKKIGLIYPPVVVERGESAYVLVSGWKRVYACLDLSLTHIPAYLLDEQDDYRAFLICLYENWSFRNFNILEKAEILHKLNGFIGDEKKIVKQFFSFLDIPANLSYFDNYLKIALLDPAWKKIILKVKERRIVMKINFIKKRGKRSRTEFLIASITILLTVSFLNTAIADTAEKIDTKVDWTLEQLYKVEGGRELAEKAKGLLVMPNVGKGALIVGIEYGEGALRIGGKTVDYYKLSAGSIGLQIGGESKDIVIAFM